MAIDAPGTPEPEREAVPEEEPHRRPVLWMVLTGVLALAVVGLAIWAFSAQSDADDAEARLAAAPAKETTVQVEPSDPAEATATATATSTSASTSTSTTDAAAASAPSEADAETQQRFEDIKGELGGGSETGGIEQALEEAQKRLDEAQKSREDAGSATDRVRAEADTFKAQSEVTRTCLRGALEALDAAFASGGLEAAVEKLDTLSGGCRDSASG